MQYKKKKEKKNIRYHNLTFLHSYIKFVVQYNINHAQTIAKDKALNKHKIKNC